MDTIRCVFLGESGVGKSTILSKMAKNNYHITPTIGVDNVLFEYKKIHFQCWDTSGSTQFGAVVNLFEKRTSHKVYVYDTSRPITFNREKLPQDGIIVANVRENKPPLVHTHIVVREDDQLSIENLMNIMTTTFETEESTISVVYDQRECCTCC
jgi:small GTP-binding protein